MPAYAMPGTPHCFVRRDFIDTFDGIVPCKGVEATVQVAVTDTGVNLLVDI
jgi:hypothetical protein